MAETKQSLDQKRLDEIVARLLERKAALPCPRCGNRQFTLLSGYFNPPIQTELKGLVIGGPSVPCVAVVCNQCGFLAQHALGVLGLQESQGTAEQKAEPAPVARADKK
jgi:ribosomal protein S27AE